MRESDIRKSNLRFNFALVTETLTEGISDSFYETISVLTEKKNNDSGKFNNYKRIVTANCLFPEMEIIYCRVFVSCLRTKFYTID